MNLEQWLVRAVRTSGAPGAAAYVGTADQTLFHQSVGYRMRTPELLAVQRDTLYDLASLTKVVATTTSILLLRDRGKLALDQPCFEFLPLPQFKAFTIRHLLTHTSGLQAMGPWYAEVDNITDMIVRIAEGGIAAPPMTQRVYSDLGYMLLGRIVEIAGQDTLDHFCARNLFAPLGMSNTFFRPAAGIRRFAAATEDSDWRGKLMQGEVHDENAYALGGVAGHAGLFSTTEDLAKFSRGLLSGKVLAPATVQEMTAFGQVAFYPWQAMGWRVDPWQSGSEGFLRSRSAFGHSGWTGTSMWLDRERGQFAILLSNTPHPQRSLRDNRTLRNTFYQAASKELYPRTTNTHTGLDRLVWDGFDTLRGKRIALLTHHAAVDQSGRHVLEVLKLCRDCRLVRIFSPEHGLAGQAEAGAQVGSQQGPVPVVSLYGTRKAPLPEELQDVDALVVDIQDAGSRYYTYPATLKACLLACKAAQKPVIVLDRPNPLGGVLLEGPIARRDDSLVCWGRVPARHGMTLGEIAQFLRDQYAPGLWVEVVTMDAWEPEFFFSQCSLPWVPPSPNLPTPESALVYAGTCLFEGTNLNEGRGTEAPFQLIGAPWADPERVLRALERPLAVGCEITPATYTPRSIPGKAATPRHQDVPCQGLRIDVQTPLDARPFGLAVGLLRAFRQAHPQQFELQENLDVLAGGSWVREQVAGSGSVVQALAALEPELRRFDRTRPRLYIPEV